MTWTDYGPNTSILILPHGTVRIDGDAEAHRWEITIETDGNRRIIACSGYQWEAKQAAYRHLHLHYRRTYENLLAMWPAINELNGTSRSPALEVGA